MINKIFVVLVDCKLVLYYFKSWSTGLKVYIFTVFAAIYTLRVSNLCLLNKTSYYQKFFFILPVWRSLSDISLLLLYSLRERVNIFSSFYFCCYLASVMSDSVRPHRRQPTRHPHPWDSPGKNTLFTSTLSQMGWKLLMSSFPGKTGVSLPRWGWIYIA